MDDICRGVRLPLGNSWGGMLLLGQLLDGVRKGFLLPRVTLWDAIEILVSLEELDSDMDD